MSKGIPVERPNDIIVVGKGTDGRLVFYMNDKMNRLKASEEDLKALADQKRADISWLIVPDNDQPEAR